MNTTRIIGLIAVVLGALSIIYGGFSYTKESTIAKVGPVEINAEQDKRVNIPLWAGLGMLAVGGGLLLAGGRK